MTSYLEWNDGLAQYFFKPDMAVRPVWLYVSEDTIIEVGKPLNAEVTDFIVAIKEGPPWASAEGLCQRALQTFRGWRDRGDLEFPPYIAYLSLFVFAAGVEGDFAQHSYYPRLRSVLEERQRDQPPSFNRMIDLWDDLEKWSIEDRDGNLGQFVARISGNQIHIGLPLAQAILSEEERRALPEIFAETNLDPTSLPPEEEIARALRQKGKGHLHRRTLSLLEKRNDKESYAALVDTVADELAEWDGTIERIKSQAEPATIHVYGTLRLCLRLDPVARRATAELRCRLKRDFPDEGLTLTGWKTGITLTCEEDQVPGWSTPLVSADEEDRFSASAIDWSKELALREERLGWRLGLSSGSVRLFVEAAGEGLPGLIEVHRLIRLRPFFLAFHEDEWPRLEQWAKEDCLDFARLQFPVGLPQGWHLAQSEGAIQDVRVRKLFPVLSFPSQVRIRFLGGVRSGPGMSFFAFAPPTVTVEGCTGTEALRCNGEVLTPSDLDSHIYTLPADLPTETRINLEVLEEGDVVRRQGLYLIGAFGWQRLKPIQAFDEWGKETGEVEGPLASGALVTGLLGPGQEFMRPLLMGSGLTPSSDPRVFLIGRVPGQISQASDGLPKGWGPVWAISLRRRGRAFFCGESIEESLPQSKTSNDFPGNIALWKEILWVRRKRVAAPKNPRLRSLWFQYVETARHV